MQKLQERTKAVVIFLFLSKTHTQIIKNAIIYAGFLYCVFGIRLYALMHVLLNAKLHIFCVFALKLAQLFSFYQFAFKYR